MTWTGSRDCWSSSQVFSRRSRLRPIRNPDAVRHAVTWTRDHSFPCLQTSSDLGDDAVAMLVELEGRRGAEYWVGFNNFYVITRYNRSRMYAKAVLELGDEISARVRKRQS